MNTPIAAKLALLEKDMRATTRNDRMARISFADRIAELLRAFPCTYTPVGNGDIDCAECGESFSAHDTAKGAEPPSPAFTDQVRDGAFVFLDCARNYMAAVAHVFSIKDGQCLAEMSPTKDQDCFDAFVQLDSTGKKLTQCCNKLDELVSAGPPQPPTAAPEEE